MVITVKKKKIRGRGKRNDWYTSGEVREDRAKRKKLNKKILGTCEQRRGKRVRLRKKKWLS